MTSDLDHDTSEVMDEMRVKFNFKFHKTSTWDYPQVQQLLEKNKKIKMIWVQTPSYSEGRLSDLKALG